MRLGRAVPGTLSLVWCKCKPGTHAPLSPPPPTRDLFQPLPSLPGKTGVPAESWGAALRGRKVLFPWRCDQQPLCHPLVGHLSPCQARLPSNAIKVSPPLLGSRLSALGGRGCAGTVTVLGAGVRGAVRVSRVLPAADRRFVGAVSSLKPLSHRPLRPGGGSDPALAPGPGRSGGSP